MLQAWAAANLSHAIRVAAIVIVALIVLRFIRVFVPRLREHIAGRQESVEDAKRSARCSLDQAASACKRAHS